MQLTKLALATAIAGVVLTQFTTTAFAADTVNQGQNQQLEVVCDVGAYGQNTNCRATGSQSQNQSVTLDRNQVVYVNGRLVHVHHVVDTAMDPKMVILGSVILLAGVATLAIKAKTR
jgi:hypothetical protein